MILERRSDVIESGKPYIERWRGRTIEAVLSLAVLVGALVLFSSYASRIDERPGVALDDPVLNVLSPIDLTWPIFAIIYGAVIAGIISLAPHPRALLLAFRAYAFLVIIRVATLYLTPLIPPADMILLVDPIAGLGPGGALRNDLFFSGHTATMFLLGLTAPSRAFRLFYFILTPILAVMLLLQHVHYTIDIVAAPFFAFGAVALACRIGRPSCRE